MTDAEFAHIEKELGLKLPEAYRKIMGRIPLELHEWPPLPGQATNRPLQDFLLDVGEVVKTQKAASKSLRRDFPEHGFAFGRTGDLGEYYWLIDTSTNDPRVQLVNNGMLLDGPANLGELFERVKGKHQEAWAEERRRKGAGDTATLPPDALVDEGRRMARPAVSLVESGNDYAAVWQGTGVVPPPEGDWRHWISLDTRFLPDNPRKLTGVLSVYLSWDDETFEQVGVFHDPHAGLPGKPDGQPLFAERVERVPPPIEAVLKLGSARIQDWVQANSIDPNDYDRRRCADQAPITEYERFIGSQHPYLAETAEAGDCFGMLGGWSWCFRWCYGTDEEYPWELFGMPLILLTFFDEPNIEVYDDGNDYVKFSRIT